MFFIASNFVSFFLIWKELKSFDIDKENKSNIFFSITIMLTAKPFVFFFTKKKQIHGVHGE